jgi:hypothetical protein
MNSSQEIESLLTSQEKQVMALEGRDIVPLGVKKCVSVLAELGIV